MLNRSFFISELSFPDWVLQAALNEFLDRTERGTIPIEERLAEVFPTRTAGDISEIIKICKMVEDEAMGIAAAVKNKGLNSSDAINQLKDKFPFMSSINLAKAYILATHEVRELAIAAQYGPPSLANSKEAEEASDMARLLDQWNQSQQRPATEAAVLPTAPVSASLPPVGQVAPANPPPAALPAQETGPGDGEAPVARRKRAWE